MKIWVKNFYYESNIQKNKLGLNQKNQKDEVPLYKTKVVVCKSR